MFLLLLTTIHLMIKEINKNLFEFIENYYKNYKNNMWRFER